MENMFCQILPRSASEIIFKLFWSVFLQWALVGVMVQPLVVHTAAEMKAMVL